MIASHIEKVDSCNDMEEAYAYLNTKIGIPPSYHKFSDISKRMQLKGDKIKRYVKIDFDPSSTQPNKEVLNTFTGWTLEHYIPSRKIDISKTLIHEYFKDVWGFGDF